MADGIYYRDQRQPWTTASLASITLAATQKCLWTPGVTSPTILPANYWFVGKTVKLTAGINWTAGTAGNIVTGAQVGAADADACNVVGVATAKVPSVGPFLTYWEGYFTCRTTGSAGTIAIWGKTDTAIGSILAATGNTLLFPSAGTVVVSTSDTTVGTRGPYFQASMSAGTDTMQVVGLHMEALN